MDVECPHPKVCLYKGCEDSGTGDLQRPQKKTSPIHSLTTYFPQDKTKYFPEKRSLYFDAAAPLDCLDSTQAGTSSHGSCKDVWMNLTCLWVLLPSSVISHSHFSFPRAMTTSRIQTLIPQLFCSTSCTLYSKLKTPDSTQIVKGRSCKNQEILRNSTKGKLTGKNADSLKERGILFLVP